MMKNYIGFLLFLGCFFGSLFHANKMNAQSTTSVTITYSGFQACGGCTVCGADYWCFNTVSSYCGNTTACGTQTFTDPVPPGNIITNIQVQYFSADCAGGSLTATINGNAFPTVNEGNTGCACSNNPCGQSASTTNTFPCGVPGYNYGTSNSLQLCTGASVCINRLVLIMTYVPANQATPATQPGAISGPTPVCSGSSNTYSIPAVANASGYTWSVPAGWTINSGQNTTSINVTAGASGGNICVVASNLCGSSASTCFPVTVTPPPGTPGTPTGSGGCSGSTQVYTTTGATGATSYTWTVPAGSVINSGQGTTSINVTLGSTSGNVCVTAGNACGTSSACLPITIGGTQATPGAPVGTTSVCAGSTQTYTTSGSGGATSYTWTVPAGSVINSGQGSSSISVTLGSTAGNICVTAYGGCGPSAPACTPITIATAPSAPGAITGNNPVCPGNQNYSISAVGGASSYTWSVAGAGGSLTGGQGTTSSSVNWPSAGTGTVTVTADNSCGTSTATTFTVLINPLPTISITPTPTVLCSGGTVTLTASGGSTYSWNGGTTPTTGNVVTATPSGNATYTVTGTDANSCVNDATVSITVNPTPTVSLVGSSSQVVCSGGTVNGINFNVTPAGSVTWTNSNTGLGGPDLSNASGSGNIGSYTAPSVGAVTTGVVTANATASGCPSTNATQATFTLTINPLPVIGSNTVTAAPCGQSTGCIDSVAVSGGAPAYQYSWDNGTTWSPASQHCNIPSGGYPLQVQDQNGCIGTATITVSNVNGPSTPTVTASAANVCVGDNVSFSINGPQATYTYSWNDASGTSTGTTYTVTNINPAGVYTVNVTATDANGCVSTNTVVSVNVNPAPTAPVLSGTVTNPFIECQGQTPGVLTVTTTGTVTSVPVWYNGSTWVATGTSYTPSTTNPGTTVYTVIDSATVTGCVNASANNVLTVTVTVNPAPAAPILSGSATNPLVECQNVTPASVTVATSGTVTSVPVWYNGSTYVTTGTSYTPSTSTPGTTIYTISDSATATGCLSSTTGNVLTVTVTIVAPPTGPVLTGTVTNPFTECEGSTPGAITVATTGTVSSVPVWYNGSTYVTTGTSYTPPTAPPGTTIYTIIDSATVGGCKDASAGNVLTVTVTVNPSPTVTNTAAVTGSCAQPTGGIGSVTPAGGTPPYHYQWFDGSTPLAGDTLPSLSNVGSGTYSVLVTDANGCPAMSGTTLFTVPSLSVVANYTPSTSQGSAPLGVIFTNGSTGATSYLWSFGSNAVSPTYTFTSAGIYTVTLVASNGPCSDSISRIIVVDLPTTIVVPNVFSPNGDGINDEFLIACTGINTLTCNIFNRWGQKLYTLTGPNQTWDGTMSNGAAASEGTYFYILSALGVDGKTYSFQGYVTLVK